MSGGCETRPIPTLSAERPAFTPRTEECQARSKLLLSCSSSRTIQPCLTSGSLKTASCLRLTAQVFSHVQGSAGDDNANQIHSDRERSKVPEAHCCTHWSRASLW